MNFRETAVAAAKASGLILEKAFWQNKKKVAKAKAGRQIVLPQDLASEKVILSLIQKSFPEHAVYSEELGRNNRQSQYCWVVDPLDGTTNYSLGLPLYGNSIALLKDQELILGVVCIPGLKRLYVAEKDRGTFLNNRRVQVNQKKLKETVLFASRGSNSQSIPWLGRLIAEIGPQVRTIRLYGWAVGELALISSGEGELMIGQGSMPYDYAAGVILVKEAGGKVTDFSGNDWQINCPDLVASNGLIQSSTLKLIKSKKI